MEGEFRQGQEQFGHVYGRGNDIGTSNGSSQIDSFWRTFHNTMNAVNRISNIGNDTGFMDLVQKKGIVLSRKNPEACVLGLIAANGVEIKKMKSLIDEVNKMTMVPITEADVVKYMRFVSRVLNY